ncbi:hypothetical protein SDC9_201631 [bioreactor metagenome]|uniref:Uncharacterized protein n=1 Tax=bioreactor metagenome TaxID=1076179 RepID=A0A645IT15_9ZZZZ
MLVIIGYFRKTVGVERNEPVVRKPPECFAYRRAARAQIARYAFLRYAFTGPDFEVEYHVFDMLVRLIA